MRYEVLREKKTLSLSERQQMLFSKAVRSSSLLRRSLSPLLYDTSLPSLHRRLTSLFSQIQRTDTISHHGFQSANLGDIGLLDRFEFNTTHKLSSLIYGNCRVDLDARKKSCVVSVKRFRPFENVIYRKGHCVQFTAAAVTLDFDKGHYAASVVHSDLIPFKDVSPIELKADLVNYGQLPFVVVLGLRGYHSHSAGSSYPFSAHALSIVHTFSPVHCPAS